MRENTTHQFFFQKPAEFAIYSRITFAYLCCFIAHSVDPYISRSQLLIKKNFLGIAFGDPLS